MNIVFDGDYLLHKTFSVVSGYKPELSLEDFFSDKKNRDILYRKIVMDLCSTINRISNVERVIFVFDSISWRYKEFTNYKHKMEKVQDSGAYKFYEFKDWLIEKLKMKGFIVTRIDGAEGDDLCYYWAKFFNRVSKNVVIISGDGDLKQLVNEYVHVFNNNSTNLNWFYGAGVKSIPDLSKNPRIQLKKVDPEYEIVKKILLGDGGDNISGVLRGFGEKTFDKFWETIKNKESLYKMIKHDNEETRAHWDYCSFLSCQLAAFKKLDNDSISSLRLAIKFNMKLTWLNEAIMPLSVKTPLAFYPFEEYLSDYKYNRPFTLEDFLNLPIK